MPIPGKFGRTELDKNGLNISLNLSQQELSRKNQ
jgi:hypothetical protein